ncbi:MAG: BA14K family protein [Hyphomicrobiales bacterium]
MKTFLGAICLLALAVPAAAQFVQPGNDQQFGKRYAPPVVTTPRGGYRPDDLPRYDDLRRRMPYGDADQASRRPMPPTGLIPPSVPPYERRYYIYNKPRWGTREWYRYCAERYPTFNPATGTYRNSDGEQFCR